MSSKIVMTNDEMGSRLNTYEFDELYLSTSRRIRFERSRSDVYTKYPIGGFKICIISLPLQSSNPMSSDEPHRAGMTSLSTSHDPAIDPKAYDFQIHQQMLQILTRFRYKDLSKGSIDKPCQQNRRILNGAV